MSWKPRHRSSYHATAEEPDDIHLDPGSTALLVIDTQNTYPQVREDEAELAIIDTIHYHVVEARELQAMWTNAS